MRKSSRHIGVLMVLSTLALGLIGAAYALWYEDLQLTANNAPWSTGLDPAMPGPQLAACVAWLGNTFGRIMHNAAEVHGFNGGAGWGGDGQINLGLTQAAVGSARMENNAATTPLQLHENESVVCRFKMILDQNPGAESKFYRFVADYRAYQWNEAPFGN